MRLAYADPPYLGCCGLYGHRHETPYGCWDHLATHEQLIADLGSRFDGWVLHCSSPSLPQILPLVPPNARTMSWVKPFAAFKANIPVAYAWEPVLVMAARKPVVADWMTTRDYIAEPITLERGTIGAKPEAVCMWAFVCMGAQPDDELVDLFPGSGAVGRAWLKYQSQLDLRVLVPETGTPQ